MKPYAFNLRGLKHGLQVPAKAPPYSLRSCIIPACKVRTSRKVARMRSASKDGGSAPEPKEQPPLQQTGAPELSPEPHKHHRGDDAPAAVAARHRAEDENEQPLLQQTLETPIVEPSNVLEANAASDLEDSDILPLLPDSLVRKAIEGYTALCVAHVALGVGLAAAAAVSPSLLLPASIASSPLGSTLLGCAGVALLRVGSLMWFLRQSASIGETATWRHQRLNAATAAFGAIALISQLYALPASSPLLSGLVLVLSAGTLAVCVQLARECSKHKPWLQWLVDPEDLGESLDSGIRFLRRDLSSIAGAACLGLLAVCTFGFVGGLGQSSAWALGGVPYTCVDGIYGPGCSAGAVQVSLTAVCAFGFVGGLGQNSAWALGGVPYTCVDGIYGPGCSAGAVQALNGLRRLCTVGLLPMAMVAHSLLELATHVRVFKAETLVASELLGSLEKDSRIGRAVSPPPERFTTLFWLGLFAASALQAAFLMHAPAVGVDVNRDFLLMAPQHWVALLSGLFSLACIFVVDWVNVQMFLGRCLHAVFSLVSGIIATTVMKHEWQVHHKL
ncbi:hypothetical protein DUNSADRAFT_13907 [Dunaliella salina]|uniref:Uncharacterized protein n=1 Tax=Dunaliella salina TaxID=3046 RepID=A0ABQ7G8F9_DUNSA|nr:hypothetical protein DUNSADRAFT_13907 [Dunaliella salina]|eukprot:KAF5830896.1 hypothetical protein DUNSADRAFT_13907 [Dunaliella salina]